MRTVGAVLLVVAAIALPSISSAQTLREGTDDTGVIQYLDSIPPDYCFLQIANPKCPPQGLRDRGQADQRARDEIARHDRMLLETYSFVDEIQNLRDRRVALLESNIKVTEAYLSKLRKKLADLQAEASAYRPYSTREDALAIPEPLATDISKTTASIAIFEQTLARTRSDQAALKKQFDDDIVRFRQLKGA